jgi:hypothetical protein
MTTAIALCSCLFGWWYFISRPPLGTTYLDRKACRYFY